MKFYRSAKTGQFLDGAARIVAAPSMERARRVVQAGSIESDWRAVGDDLRSAMRQKDRREVA